MDFAGIIDRERLAWGLGLMLGFPLLVLLLGEAIVRLRRAGNPLARILGILRAVVLPLLGVYVLLAKILQVPPEDTAIRLIQTVVGVVVLYAALSFLNRILFSDNGFWDWHDKVPVLFRDVARLVLVVVGAAYIYSQVWGKSLEGLVTALGIGSIVVGLALQEPLGHLVSGLLLMAERPIALGDWIEVGDEIGKVIEVNWRSVHVRTFTNEVVIIPNAELNKSRFMNLSRPTPLRTETIELGFSYDDPPNKVKEVLLELARTTEGVLKDPPPAVYTVNYADSAVTYKVWLSVARQEDLKATRDRFMTRVWYAAKRHGLNIPFPMRTVIHQTQAEVEARSAVNPAEELGEFALFRARGNGAAEVAGASIRQYGKGERVAVEGAEVPGLCLVLGGSAALSVRGQDGQDHEISRISRGDYFGENATLSGQASEFTVTSLEDLQVLVLPPESMAELMQACPWLGREVGKVLDVRRQAARAVRRLSVPSPN